MAALSLQLRNTETRYGQVGRLMHWTSVALLAVIVIVSVQLEDLADGPGKTALVGRHASFGLLLLVLMFLRAGWRSSNVNPIHSYTIPGWQKKLAQSIHLFVYAIVISQCIVGVVQVMAYESAVTLFGIVVVEPAGAASPGARELLHELHEWMANVIYVTVSIHVAAAIYHQIFGVVGEEKA